MPLAPVILLLPCLREAVPFVVVPERTPSVLAAATEGHTPAEDGSVMLRRLSVSAYALPPPVLARVRRAGYDVHRLFVADVADGSPALDVPPGAWLLVERPRKIGPPPGIAFGPHRIAAVLRPLRPD